jgi:MoaA/NifB/PqqE/SkfB family radical SAM enzyme
MRSEETHIWTKDDLLKKWRKIKSLKEHCSCRKGAWNPTCPKHGKESGA